MNSNDPWDDYWKGDDDHAWWKTPAPEVEDFIRSQNPQERPNVLDLGCGLGRHAISFVRAGFSVTASDSSREAIAHLTNWARDLSLEVRTMVCDGIPEEFLEGSFDIVLAYNVIYHGTRDDFTEAIGNVYKALNQNGLFYFTCPTRDDGKYDIGEEVAPHTFKCTKSIIPGDIHYFPDESDLADLLSDFELVNRERIEGYWDNKGARQFYSNWHILAQK
jgi:SAM-dependent methyltransferase